jgi:hypothetical protein
LLTPQWTIWDVKAWLDSLEEEQDYAITIEVISNNSEISFTNRPRITLSR